MRKCAHPLAVHYSLTARATQATWKLESRRAQLKEESYTLALIEVHFLARRSSWPR